MLVTWLAASNKLKKVKKAKKHKEAIHPRNDW